jgi:hypothetical protein
MPRLASVATMHDVRLASVLYEHISKAGIPFPEDVKGRLEGFQSELMEALCEGYGIASEPGCLAHIPDTDQIPARAVYVLNRFAMYLRELTAGKEDAAAA